MSKWNRIGAAALAAALCLSPFTTAARAATSLRAAGAPGVDRATLLTAYLVHLAGLLRDDTGPGGAVRAAYVAACATVGREVEVHEPGGGVRTGVATGVDDAGRLTVRSATGPSAVSAGDVLHVRSR